MDFFWGLSEGFVHCMVIFGSIGGAASSCIDLQCRFNDQNLVNVLLHWMQWYLPSVVVFSLVVE